MMKKDIKMKKAAKNFYSFENYKPNKNAKPIVYKGTQYLSKAQCMALEGITRKELDEYLKGQDNDAGVRAPEQDIINEIIGEVEAEAEDALNDDDFENFVEDDEPF